MITNVMCAVAGVMKRLHLYRGDGIEVRLHLFEDRLG